MKSKKNKFYRILYLYIKYFYIALAFIFFAQNSCFADIYRYARLEGVGQGLLSTQQEYRQTSMFAPQYLKTQQMRHEDIISQKSANEEMIGEIKSDCRNDIADVPLKRKAGGNNNAGSMTDEKVVINVSHVADYSKVLEYSAGVEEFEYKGKLVSIENFETNSMARRFSIKFDDRQIDVIFDDMGYVVNPEFCSAVVADGCAPTNQRFIVLDFVISGDVADREYAYKKQAELDNIIDKCSFLRYSWGRSTATGISGTKYYQFYFTTNIDWGKMFSECVDPIISNPQVNNKAAAVPIKENTLLISTPLNAEDGARGSVSSEESDEGEFLTPENFGKFAEAIQSAARLSEQKEEVPAPVVNNKPVELSSAQNQSIDVEEGIGNEEEFAEFLAFISDPALLEKLGCLVEHVGAVKERILAILEEIRAKLAEKGKIDPADKTIDIAECYKIMKENDIKELEKQFTELRAIFVQLKNIFDENKGSIYKDESEEKVTIVISLEKKYKTRLSKSVEDQDKVLRDQKSEVKEA